MKLIDWLAKKRMSAAEFADRIGFDRSTVSRWLDDASPTMPRKDARARIKEETGGEVLPSDFVDDDDEPSPSGPAEFKAASA